MRLIDADEAIKAVHDEFDGCLVWDESGETTADEVATIILQIPTVDPVKHGRWEDCSNGWMCSVCKHDARKDYPYCPHCGAMMDEEDDHDDHL